VPGEELGRILNELADTQGDKTSAGRLCGATLEALHVAGAGVMLMSGDTPHGSLCTTNSVSSLIEELQYTLGEGPCVDAHTSGTVVTETDLAHPEIPRWPAFTPRVLEVGVRAVFGFPLRGGEVRLGALNLYQDRPGPLSADQHADALTMADVISHWVIDVQSSAAPGDLADALENSDLHFIVHNAAGMVSVQLGISVSDALIRLRAHAFREDRPVRDVAEDVVAHRLLLS
jgi:GAF domain-containing protein